MNALIDVGGLHVRFGTHTVVRGVSFTLQPGEILVLVGESGAGKSVTARALLGMAGEAAHVSADRLDVLGHDVLTMSAANFRALRGAQAALILQDAQGALDPLARVGPQVTEALALRSIGTRTERWQTAVDLLKCAGVPEPDVRSRQYPGQLSGGLRQRVLIASALAMNPSVMIADEPTTALDVAMKARILDVLLALRSNGRGILLISHDLAAVASIADRVMVMYRGEIVETGRAASVLTDPHHPYTKRLVSSIPTGYHTSAVHTSSGAASVPVLEARGVSKSYASPVLDGVSIVLHRGETVGLIGPSGTGKSTLLGVLLGTVTPSAGQVLLDGEPVSPKLRARRRDERRRIQFVPQDPLATFDPRHSARRILEDALSGNDPTIVATPDSLASLVGLRSELLNRRPVKLSGGQRQRLAIARALAHGPDVLLCDEPVSALDVTIQAEVLVLLASLQLDLGMAMLFVSHDPAVVSQISDRIVELRDAKLLGVQG